MHFNDLIHHITHAPHDAQHRVSAEWGQGRALFGGLIGAMIFAAMRRDLNEKGGEAHRAMSFSLSFVAPLAADTDFTISTQVLRAGKNSVQIEGKITQNGMNIATALALFGVLRESSVLVESEPGPQVPHPDGLFELPYVPNVVPEFTRLLTYRWAFGGLPFSNTREREMGGWVRFKDEHNHPTPVDADTRLVALIDAWPPATLPHLSKPAPASSMTWHIQFIQPEPASDDWLLYRADIDHAAGGYGQVRAHIWNQTGELIALSSQTVAVFE